MSLQCPCLINLTLTHYPGMRSTVQQQPAGSSLLAAAAPCKERTGQHTRHIRMHLRLTQLTRGLAPASFRACQITAAATSQHCRRTARCQAAASMTKIGTHSGTFHCDEALGCFLLQHTPHYKDAEVVRSREPAVLDTCDLVLDVGGTYEPEKQRYDHHQRGFNENFGHGFGTKLSSAGLIYKHYGRQIIAQIMGKQEADEAVQTVYLRVYEQFMQAIDAIDNGVNQWDSAEPARYTESTNLSSRVAKLNPRWNEEFSEQALYQRFLQAMQLTGQEFLQAVDYSAHAWLPGREIVEQCLLQRHSVHPSGAVFELSQYCPWKEHLYDLERKHGIEGQLKFCLYQDERSNWRIQAVSKSPGSFENRLSLPAAWQGLRDEELSKVSGIPGGVFVHASGFIGGNKTHDGVLAMAKGALEQAGEPAVKKPRT